MKDVDKLICPKCGANNPIMNVKVSIKAVPIRKVDNKTYDLDIDIAGIAKKIDFDISTNLAYCTCSKCGTRIHYYE